jgi:phosphoserine aminotransferase
MYNTPPTYGIYLCGKVFKWLLNLGGLEAIHKINVKKANLIYDYLDQSQMFFGTVEKKSRSLMNVCFKSTSPELDDKFIKEAKALGFDNLKGHRSVGGMRASIYNAMPVEGVAALVEFMKEFEKRNRG